MRTLGLATVVASVVSIGGGAGAHPLQHGPTSDHLVGTGESGDLQLLSSLRLTDDPEIIADVGVDPRGTHAYLAHWGKATCAENSEAGGRTDPDAGVFVVDISDLAAPRHVGFIPHSQDSRPGEGVQALEVSTRFFDGVMLVTNNEQCGKNGKGGVSLFDVTDPEAPRQLSQNFGDRGFADTHDIHSAFAWDVGDAAYVVTTDNIEFPDVDIFDISNPRRPRIIAELNLNTFSGGVAQPELELEESFLHDMIVKQIGGRWIMLLSYWDGGFVRLDVTDPRNPVFIHDTDYPSVDPLLLERTGKMLPPEGNGHQAEFTANDRFFIGTDEDFSPYRPIFTIETGPDAGHYPAGEFSFTPPIGTTLSDGMANGPVVYGGYGCPDDRGSIPSASSVFPSVGPEEERIIVFQRGPVGDPSASGGACFFSEKIESGQLAGYDVVIVANHHSGAAGGSAADAPACGSQGHDYDPIAPAICIGHRAMHLLFGSTPSYDPSYSQPEPVVGTVGERVRMKPVFDGWGYVWLFDAQTGAMLDAYAIPEAHDEAYAEGFGDLTVHEVATDPIAPYRAYLSYYSGGMRALEIRCADYNDHATCELVETGSYLDPDGNDFWGVEAFVRDGKTIVLGSDRSHGLWIFTTERS